MASTQASLKLSRRTVLKSTTGLVVAAYLAPFAGSALAATKARAAQAVFAPNAFIRVGTDNTVTVLVKHIEFGQGPFTGLATIVAEEMDADWAQMRAEHAPADAKLYNNLAFGPVQGTGGSTAIANSYDQLRQAGATARALLVQAAAERWRVPAKDITVERGVLRHAASGKQGRFGEFALAASRLPAPAPTEVRLKDPSEFRLIGREGAVRKLDVPAKTNGTAQFTIDIHEPNMLTVVVAHPPLFGAKVASFDAIEALAVKGVVEVKQVPTGVAVYAESTWPAIKGREKLRITWDESAAEKRGSEQILAEYRAAARSPGAVADAHGNVDTTLASAERVIETEYAFPYLAHSPMEPLDGFLRWNDKGATARFGSQIQTLDQAVIAGVLGLKPEQVAVETMLAGGSFGRRGEMGSDFANELAQVAKAIGPQRPVKLMWTRDDDVQGGRYRPMFVHRMRGGLRGGKVVAWSDTIVGQSFIQGTMFESMLFKNGIDATMVEGANEIPYKIENFRCDLHIQKVGVPTLSWRSVGSTHTGYAVECFVDQLLQTAGQDPVEGRMALFGDDPRFKTTLRAVADLAKWSGPAAGSGRARGVSIVKAFGTYVAHIAEVSMGENGEPRVHKVWCAVDCGRVVNPDIVRAQMEGGIGFGLGHILYGEIRLEGGRRVQRNFDTYRSLRIHEMPAIEVKIVDSTEKPTGVGEPGVPPIGPAVANALARLAGGERPRQLPMVREAA
ncbi:xanthine dehydrogenase family protein molybdopterin-binding subunit [Variovorax paradoxus]|nr:xanthine dehydrogenase family protein molybdopterin-binding subunit [Variovorax paradoxus]MBT2300457.1 xanthine dehydrogenase family protein molybdopterin-binding subunit [Variovorax paradoxus]